jgi:hypothetical protein
MSFYGDQTNVISADELKQWLAGLRDDDLVGMEEGLDALYRGRQRLDRDRRSAEGGRMAAPLDPPGEHSPLSGGNHVKI